MLILGIDVGGRRKGFDLAAVAAGRLVYLRSRCSLAAAVDAARELEPVAIGIDAPCECAPDGARSRADERALSAAVCAIRYTPDARTVAQGGPYYEWIRHGLELYAALAELPRRPALHEVFPTASWTSWRGPRGDESRAAWSIRGLAALGIAGAPARTSQDARDAIAAAVTIAEHVAGRSRRFGRIVVPPPSRP